MKIMYHMNITHVRAAAALSAGWSYKKIGCRYGSAAAKWAYMSAHPTTTGRHYWSKTQRRFISSRA